MRKIVSLCLICFAPALWATEARVVSLGGETAMLPKDDTNIDLFPQAINEWELLRIANIDKSETPNVSDYAVLVGKPGDKWGLYGGSTEVNDFINVYRSLSDGKALKVGFTLSTDKTEVADTTTEYTDIGVNFKLGMDKGDTELAYTFVYSKDPLTAPCTTAPNILNTCGRYTPTPAGGAGSTKNYNAFLARFDIRKPKDVAIFDTFYANAYLGRSSFKNNQAGSLVTEDATTLGGEVLFFNQKNFGAKDFLVYGIGFALGYTKASDEPTGGASSDNKQLVLGGPRIRLGLEKDIKYGVLRFGVRRDIDFYYSDKTSTSGAANDNTSGVGKNGSYTITTGWGFTYRKLQIDIVLNDIFWSSGPQLVFDGSLGSIGTRADIVYNF